MNGPKCVKNKLLLHMAVHNTTVFMHDGAPCHRYKIVKKFFEVNHVMTLDWTGNSPSLHPIENLLAKMKNLVLEKQPLNGKTLINTIKEVGLKKISTQYCMSLIASICLVDYKPS